ncbi:unnamed protein product [Microthlaspi erraticum]|uniref:Integrase catalytic domain-containing protein n=1 Tax=Microthlaspi erraticum TaxID=1685480 RepID=A0A6D2HN99_9BRAS|nr:unnamed protein product [Microthlaspi erraticum]
MLMENLLRSKEWWDLIETGIPTRAANVILTGPQRTELAEKTVIDHKVKNYLFASIDKTILKTILKKETSKDLWESMKRKYQGNDRVQSAQLQRLRRDFEVLEMKIGETITAYFSRVMEVANNMRNLGEEMPDSKVVEKIMRTLVEKFTYVVCAIEESNDIKHMTVDGLQSSLMVHEQNLSRHAGEERALKVEGQWNSYGRGRGNSPTRGRGRGGYQGRGRGGNIPREQVECYKCHKKGHYKSECPEWDKEANYAEFDEDMVLMAHVENKEEEEYVWFLDSGCSNHMCGTKEWFTDFDGDFRHNVKLGDDRRLVVEGKGSLRLEINGMIRVITSVYYVPGLRNNLLSIGQLQEKGLRVVIEDNVCEIWHKQQKEMVMYSIMTKNRMFIALAKVRSARETEDGKCLLVSEKTEKLWHRRFGHLNYGGLRILAAKKMVNGLPITGLEETEAACDICFRGKQNRHSIPKKSDWKSTTPLQLVHSDICGPISPISESGKRYIINFIDDFSRKCWTFLLTEKSEAFQVFKEFKAAAERESGQQLVCLRTDRGGEYSSKAFEEFCRENGIKRQLTAAYTPQQNGVAEMKNRSVMNMTRCMLLEMSVPRRFWAEAVQYAVHILNRSPSAALGEITPEEKWSQHKPSVEYLKIFGCVAFALVPYERRIKLDEKSVKCVMFGLSKESKAYRLAAENLNEPEEQNAETSDETENEEEENGEEGNEEAETTQEVVVNPTPAREGGRNRQVPVWMKDYVQGNTSNAGFVISEDGDDILAMFIATDDPDCFEEAVQHEVWRKAMEAEIKSIEENHTWELMELPLGAKVIGVKWVFKTKFNERGEIDKFKARLVAKGYHQKHGIDFHEVFAPVARWDTIRSILALAAKRDWSVYQLDVKSAFLHGELNEDVYVEQPKGFILEEESNKVYKLRKALYGLKQAPRAWYSRIEGYFMKEKFEKAYCEHTLFVKRRGDEILIVSLYVDDLIYTGNSS